VGIEVIEATYGRNCANDSRPILTGNVTTFVGRACNQEDRCRYSVNVQVYGDPAPLCAKDFSIRYRCDEGKERVAVLPPEANGHEIELVCAAPEMPGVK
jgi:hypothetical protein